MLHQYLSSFKLKEASAYAANWINADHGVSGWKDLRVDYGWAKEYSQYFILTIDWKGHRIWQLLALDEMQFTVIKRVWMSEICVLQGKGGMDVQGRD